jgi:hypothetical protein
MQRSVASPQCVAKARMHAPAAWAPPQARRRLWASAGGAHTPAAAAPTQRACSRVSVERTGAVSRVTQACGVPLAARFRAQKAGIGL